MSDTAQQLWRYKLIGYDKDRQIKDTRLVAVWDRMNIYIMVRGMLSNGSGIVIVEYQHIPDLQ